MHTVSTHPSVYYKRTGSWKFWRRGKYIFLTLAVINNSTEVIDISSKQLLPLVTEGMVFMPIAYSLFLSMQRSFLEIGSSPSLCVEAPLTQVE